MTADAVGGVWTYALDLARGLAQHDVRTTLAVLGPPPEADARAAITGVPGLSVVATGLPLDWTASEPDQVLAAGRTVAALARELEVDLVHLNSPALAAEGVFDRPAIGVCHSCVATWWTAVRGGPLPPDFRWRADLVRRGYAGVDALVAPSNSFARATADAYDLPSAPRVVVNGRAPLAAVPHGTDHGEQAVLTAGRLWDEGKNLATLDRAAARLPIPVFAAGPTRGPNGAAIEFAHLRVEGAMSGAALGRRLARRPIFVSLARYEPFGLAVLEAAQAGCPLVLSDIPTFRELWDGAARFVDPHDDCGCARIVQALLDDRSKHDRLGAAARDRSRIYTVERLAVGTVAAYRDALGTRRAAAA
jgi:glycosyltransferase involved in cell wall biosynthesis